MIEQIAGGERGIELGIAAANGSATVTIGGSNAQLNAVLASSNLLYHSNIGFSGNDSLDLLLNDNGNSGTGGALTDHKVPTITVGGPVLTNIESTVLSFTEKQPPEAITQTIALADATSPTIASATIQFTAGFAAGQDVLGFANQNGIAGS